MRSHARAYAPFARPDYQIQRTRKTVAAASFPLTLEEVKEWVGVNDSDSDSVITGLIGAATDMAELFLRRSLIESTYTLTLDQWAGAGNAEIWQGSRIGVSNDLGGGSELALLIPSLLAVVSIVTHDRSNTASTFDPTKYYIDNSDPNQYGRIILNSDTYIPSQLRPRNAVVVTYTAGYGANASHVPYAIKQGLLRLIAHLFNQRGFCSDGDGLNKNGAAVEPIEVSGAAGLLAPYRIARL